MCVVCMFVYVCVWLFVCMSVLKQGNRPINRPIYDLHAMGNIMTANANIPPYPKPCLTFHNKLSHNYNIPTRVLAFIIRSHLFSFTAKFEKGIVVDQYPAPKPAVQCY